MRTAKDRDDILGKALVRELQEECEMEHPTLEEMAALIDGKLSPDERTGIMGHLGSCERCYEVFNLSSEMVKEQQQAKQTARLRMPFTVYKMLPARVQGLSRIANYKMPLAFAAGMLIAIGALLMYNNLQTPSPQVVALKVAPQKEAPPVLAPAEIKETPPSLIVSAGGDKQEGTKSSESIRKEKPAPVYYARVEVNDAVGEFLNDTPDDVVTDKKQIGQLVAMLVRDDRTIGGYDISEVRIEHGETIMRSTRSSAQKAEIRIRNGVLTIRLVD